jgi:hypothetical protein
LGILGKKQFGKLRVPLFVFSWLAPLVLLGWELPRIYPLASGVGAAPQSWHISFGASIIPARIMTIFGSPVVDSIWITSPIPRIVGFFAVISSVVLVFVGFRQLLKSQLSKSGRIVRNFSTEVSQNPFYSVCFFGGSGAHVLAFLPGTNFDYRLIFLILLLVPLLVLMSQGDILARLLAVLSLASLYLSLAPFPVLGRLGFNYYEVPGEIISLILAVLLGALCLLLLFGRLPKPLDVPIVKGSTTN